MAEDKTVGIKVEVDSKQATKSLGDLENEFERLNEEIRKVPINSKEFQELNKQIAQTGREVKNLELSMESLDNEQVASELGSVAGAVGDVSAAFILLGDDSETMQEVAKNIEFAMGLSMGLKGAIEGVSSANKLLTNSQIAQNVVQNLTLQGMKKNILALFGKTAATTADTAATAGATTATGFFGKALNLLPIFAIITGLTLLVVFFDKVKGAMMAVGNYIYEMFKPQIDLVVDALQYLGIMESDEEKARAARQSAAIEERRRETKLKIALIDAEIEANKKLTNEITSSIDFEIAKKQAAGKDFSGLEREKLQLLIASTQKELELIDERNQARIEELQIIAKMNNFAGNMAKKRLKEIEEERLGLQKNLEKLNQDLEIFEIKQTKIKSDEAAKAKEDRDKNNDKEVEDEKKKNEELLKEKQKLRDEAFKLKLDGIIAEEKVAEDYRKRQLNEEQKEIDDLNDKFNSELEAIGDNNELRLLLEDEFQANVKAIEDKYKKEREEAEKENKEKEEEDARTELEKKLEEVSKFNQSIISLNDAVLEAQLAGAEGNEAKQEEFRKKAFERNKKLQLAQATIDGVRAVISTYGSTPGGLIIKSAAAAIAGITALENIKKIASTAYAGSSGGGGSAPSSLGNTARGANGANVDQVTNTTTTIGEPTKVYVTEQDISNTQNKVSVNEAQATI